MNNTDYRDLIMEDMRQTLNDTISELNSVRAWNNRLEAQLRAHEQREHKKLRNRFKRAYREAIRAFKG